MTNSLKLSDQRILVTGASGFIGSHLCRSLHKSGAEVHAVSRKTYTSDDPCLHWWQGDLSDIEVVRKIISAVKPDIIFHLASHVAGARHLDLVLPMFNSNLCAAVNILTVATETGCRRIVLAGSLEEPGLNDNEMVPCSPYAAAKWAASMYARMFYALYKTPVVIARLFMVYGPGQNDLSKLVPYVTLSLLREEAPKLSSGKREVDWIYVEDVVDGLIAMAHSPKVNGCTIDLGSGNLVAIRTVVEHIAEYIDSPVKPLFGALADRPMEQVRVANTATTYDAIRWKPTTSLEKGLERTVNWYKENLDARQIAD
ncbi:MAG: NAD(P)-dependent oxidoreductase [Thermodesulfovibrionales bacterium]